MTDFYCQVFGLLPNGEKWSTGRHITSGRPLATMLSVWGAAWDSAWTNGTYGLQGIYPTDLTVTGYSAASLDGNMREIAKQLLSASHAGVDSADSLPSNVSIVLSWRSSQDVRKTARGNQKLPGPSNDKVIDDKLDSVVQGHVSAAINAVKSAVIADGSTFFVFPRFNTFSGPLALSKTVIDTVTCRDKVGTMKKRIRKEAATYV